MPTTDPAKRREVQRRYRESHREQLRASGREYMRARWAEDPDTMKDANRRSYEAHAEQRRAAAKAYSQRRPLYATWTGMRGRCRNENNPRYDQYGGRGIQMCDEWYDSYEVFAAWIETNLGPRPDGMTLDRIDNDGNYEPGNVRWATAKQQQRHRVRDAQGRLLP